MLFLVLSLLVAAVAAQQIAYFPPPNSVDDYIRVDVSKSDSPITEVTIAAWAKQATPHESDGKDGFFFSYMSSTSNRANMLLLGGNVFGCISFWVSNNGQKSSSCSSYSVSVGTSNTYLTISLQYFSSPASVCTYCVFS